MFEIGLASRRWLGGALSLVLLTALGCSRSSKPAPAVDSAAGGIAVGASPIRGPKNAPVTLVEFSDFQCPYCVKSADQVRLLLAAYPRDLRLVYKHMPLVIHQNARSAAKAAIAANMQGKFWEMHDGLFKSADNLGPDAIKGVAQQIGLDMAKFEVDWNSTAANKVVQDDLVAARAAHASSTPSFFINGRSVTNPSFENLKAMVEEELRK